MHTCTYILTCMCAHIMHGVFLPIKYIHEYVHVYDCTDRYVNGVRPGQYGVPRPFYFPFQPSYWLGRPHGTRMKVVSLTILYILLLCTYMYVHVHLQTCTGMYTCMYVYMYVRMCTISGQSQRHVRTCTYVHQEVCKYGSISYMFIGIVVVY